MKKKKMFYHKCIVLMYLPRFCLYAEGIFISNIPSKIWISVLLCL